MYLLSDESRSIARLESHLRPEASGVAAVEVWLLPQTIVQPEGLVIQEDMVPLVAIDRQDTGENLFRLQSLSV
jgi:hypothetical protein